MRYHVTLTSAIMQAKSQSCYVVVNKVYYKWKSDMIEICDEAIACFNSARHFDLNFVEGILAKITWKKFQSNLTWKVTAEVKNCSITTSEVKEDTILDSNHSLYLAYGILTIHMSANENN